MKCGTTSLYEYLRAHSTIDMIRVKELNFYNNETHWAFGRDWYESHFANDGRMRGDVNPNYAMFPLCQQVPERLHLLYPETRLIYSVREPVSRLVSHIQHNLAEGKETRDIESLCLDLELGRDPFNYVGNSLYWMQLQRFLEFFPASQIQVVAAIDLKHDRGATLTGLLEFLDLPPFPSDDAFGFVSHESERKRRYSAGLRQLFHDPKFGSAAGTLVQFAKRLLPTSVYERLRSAASRPVPPVRLTENQTGRLAPLFRDDSRQLEEFCGRRLWN